MRRYFGRYKLSCVGIIIFATLSSLGSIGIAYILQNIVDSAIDQNLDRFRMMIIISIFYFIIFGIINYIYQMLANVLSARIIKDIRADIFNGAIQSDYELLSKKNMGEVISLVANDSKVIEDDYIKSLFALIENIITFLGTLIAFIYISPTVTLFLVGGVALLGTIPNLTGKILEQRQSEFSGINAKFVKNIKDILDGLSVIKPFSKEQYFSQVFEVLNADVKLGKIRVNAIQAIGDSLSFIFGFLLMVIVISISAYQVLIGVLTLGTMLALVQLSNTFVNPIIQSMSNMAKIKGTGKIIEKISANESQNRIKKEGNIVINSEISVHQLNYSVEERNILSNINLIIECGKKYAVIGESGSGKTTLLKILAGLIRNYDGNISCDGVSILDKKGLINSVSIVNQEVYIFGKSIIENIVLGSEIDDERLEEVISISQLKKVIERSECDDLGENGKVLSGGERQRIAIARALYHRKSILLLDEVTSALDRKISDQIERELLSIEGLTIVAVSHKIDEENITFYDDVIHISGGTVVSQKSVA